MKIADIIKFGPIDVVKGALMSVASVAGGMARKPTCWMLTHTVGAEGGRSL